MNAVKMWLSRFSKNLKRYCRNITLHGFINISESKSGWEMAFWLSVQALCFALCLWLMIIHWLRYQSRPTVTTIKSTAYPISEIPFPAVTICNSNVAHKNQTGYYEKLLLEEGVNEKLVNEYFKRLNNLIHLSLATEFNITQFDEIENLFKKYEITSEKLMKNIMHPCDEMLHNCTWSGGSYNCSQMFRVIRTGLGFCCSFNYFNDRDRINQPGIPDLFKKNIIADGAGLAHGLGFVLNIAAEEYMSAVLPFVACFVMVHPIWDFSDLATFSVTLQPGDFALMQLIPTVFTADESLRTVSVSKRNCWFENEGHLESARDYSFTNCVVECKKRAIYELCQCVPFFYPRDNRKQCTLQDVACLKKNELRYNSIKLAGKIVDNSTACDCLPQCSDTSYDGYVNTIRNGMPTNTAQIYIYFDHSWCVEYNMSLNLTWDMLLASLGGIFGLCLGGSLISLIECVYYLVKSICLTFLQGRQTSPANNPTKTFNKKGLIRFVQVQPRY